MFSDLVLFHRNGGQTPLSNSVAAVAGSKTAPDFFFFKTCLRQIALVDNEAAAALLAADSGELEEVYRGADAYHFLLQVICGLRSPLVGETEVQGQFKIAVAAYPLPATPWGFQLKKFFQNLFEDAKRIRQAHLVDLGSQSYGSVLRRDLRGVKRIHVLGAGHLVQEILPWVAKDGTEVHVHCRDLGKAKAALGKHDGVTLHSLSEKPVFLKGDAFVVAAPVSAAWVKNWTHQGGAVAPGLIADLRSDSAEDRVQLDCRIVDLQQIFGSISKTQARLEACKAAALEAISAAVRERDSHVEYRPFGWEDVCA